MALIVYLNLYAIGFLFIPLNDWIRPSELHGETDQVLGPEMLTSRLIYYVVTGQVRLF